MQVGYTPGVLTAATADMTVTLLLATSRRLLEGGASENNLQRCFLEFGQMLLLGYRSVDVVAQMLILFGWIL